MKLSTTFAAVATLAVTCWAVPSPAVPPAPPSTSAAYFQAAACPTPAAAAKKVWKHGRPEYNDLIAIGTATGAAAKARLAAAFVEKYPDSDYKNDALLMEMQAQARAPATQPEALQTAAQVLKSPNAEANQLLAADVIVSFLAPNLTKPGEPDLESKMQNLLQAATCGDQMLSNASAAQQAQYGLIFGKAKGFAQLNLKDYSGAIATLSAVAQKNPTQPLPYYWMGIAEVTQQTPDYNDGVFYLAKASVLSPSTTAIANYLNTVYSTYHGSADGLQDVISAARKNATPPAGFKVLSKVDMENAANLATYKAELEKRANELPPPNSFAGIKARLLKPTLASQEWKSVKGVGFELSGYVTEISDKAVTIAVGTDPAAQGDLHVTLFQPLKTKRPKVGDKVTVQGLVDTFKPNPPDPNVPFMLSMKDGSIEGFSAKAGEPSGGQ
ncbi:MAG: hypothetical protein ACRD1C_00680 [Terriglobales bacterium]